MTKVSVCRLFMFFICVSTLPGFCTAQCGEIRLVKGDENRDLEGEFEGCRSAKRLFISGTLLHSLHFLDNLQVVEDKDTEVSAAETHVSTITIVNNPYLHWDNQTLRSLKSIAKNPYTEVSTVYIKGNARMCVPPDAIDRLRDAINKEGQGVHVQRCYCYAENAPDREGSSILHGLGRCKVVTGDLIIRGDGMDEQMQETLSEVEEIYGRLMLLNTTMKNTVVFKHLEKIVVEHVGDESDYALTIADNPYLKNFSFPSLDFVDGNGMKLVRLEGNERMRVSQEERDSIYKLEQTYTAVDSAIQMIKISPSVCRSNDEPVSDANWEVFHLCNVIVGDLIINTQSFKIIQNESKIFYEVGRIEGCLTIENTQFTSLNFLAHLQNVTCNKDRPAVLIRGNSKLLQLDLQLFNVTSKEEEVRVENNKKICRKHANQIEQQLRVIDRNATVVMLETEAWKECVSPLHVNSHGAARLYGLLAGLAFLLVLCTVAEIIIRMWGRRHPKAL